MDNTLTFFSVIFGVCHKLAARFTSLMAPIAIFVAVLYFSLPTLFYLFPSAMQRLFFLNFVKLPNVDYNNISSHGVNSRGRNFYINTLTGHSVKSKSIEEQPIIGVWHILPDSLSQKIVENERTGALVFDNEIENLLSTDFHGIFLYFHGNSFDRTQHHRVQVYNMLSSLDFHILAIDYQGYGDSSGHPSETALVSDAHAIFQYANKLAPSKDIFVWGHSMGSGIATRLVAELSDNGLHPRSLVLEAPFNNLLDVINHHWLSTGFRHLPWFNYAVVYPLMQAGLVMSSDERITRVKCPIMVIHSEDDHIIPIKLARKLVQAAKAVHGENAVKFVEFEAGKNYFHKLLYTAPELKPLVHEFTSRSSISNRSKSRRSNELTSN